MGQIFSPAANLVAKASVAGFVVGIAGVSWAWWGAARSSSWTRAGLVREQPIPFSHAHHVHGVGLDCRYCHTSVEESAFAGIPPTSICMNCHTQIWSDAPLLEPVRLSYAQRKPIVWTRVHDMPDFVYFDHSIHVAKGIGCETCHGRVDLMPLMKTVRPMFMSWCLECHRHPERFLRPRDEVFSMEYEPAEGQGELGVRLREDYEIRSQRAMTDCVTCHR